MKTLVVITGVSGSGKSTVARQMYEEIEDSTFVSVDTIKEFIYDLTGFKDTVDKKRLSTLSYDIFKSIIENCMSRRDKTIIVEYPFNKEWANYFSLMASTYGYHIIVVNVRCNNYDIIWNRLNTRNNSADRHPSHSITEYNIRVGEDYLSSNELDRASQEISYYSDKYTSLGIGEELNYVSDNGEIKWLVDKILGM